MARFQPSHPDLDPTYPCPICQRGQLQSMPLMEVLACDRCRHLFSLNPAQRSLQVEDYAQPLTWRWDGRRWRGARQISTEVTGLVWVFGIALLVLPTALVWLSSYVFPPLVDSPGARFSQLWIGLTGLSHFLLVAAVLLEHYQPSLYLLFKLWLLELRSELP